jgi:hypothetical protein
MVSPKINDSNDIKLNEMLEKKILNPYKKDQNLKKLIEPNNYCLFLN